MDESTGLFGAGFMIDSEISDLDLDVRRPAEETGTHGPSSAARWEADAVNIEPDQVLQRPDECQQDLAERINTLTRTINTHAQLCVELSHKLVGLAQENKHLYHAAGSTLLTYVLRPCLRLGCMLRTYYPSLEEGVLQVLREYEGQVRRTVANRANGRTMARIGIASAAAATAGGNSPDERELDQLKNRLLEQHTLLHHSNQHVHRLIRERDRLRTELMQQQRGASDEGTEDALASSGGPDGLSLQGLVVKDGPGAAVLTDQLRELRVLVDQLILHDVTQDARRNTEDGMDQASGDDYDVDDDDWTLL